MEANNDNNVMIQEMELLKNVPNILTAQRMLGSEGTAEHRFFFGHCKLRRGYIYEAVAIVFALILDSLVVAAAIAAVIFTVNVLG
jgi:hypothetical protein